MQVRANSSAKDVLVIDCLQGGSDLVLQFFGAKDVRFPRLLSAPGVLLGGDEAFNGKSARSALDEPILKGGHGDGAPSVVQSGNEVLCHGDHVLVAVMLLHIFGADPEARLHVLRA